MDPSIALGKMQIPSEQIPSELLSNAMPPDQVQQQQAQSFEKLMNADQTNTSQMVAPDKVTQSPSIVGKIVEGQDALLNTSLNELNDLQTKAANSQIAASSGEMSPQQIMLQSTQMAVESMKVAKDLAMTNMNLEVKVSMVDSLKQATNTLLRNQ